MPSIQNIFQKSKTMLMIKRYISFEGKRGAVKKGIIISIPLS